jgi:phosphatidyl-myo-inositol alpha-mannosyltransferase
VRIGLVSPYPWDVPGGVVAHIDDLATALAAAGHTAEVFTPVDDDDVVLPPHVTRAGSSVPVPYNGSVSRLLLGPVSAARARRWLRDGDFDVLHLHSPETFSLSLLTLINAGGPIVATFHAANPRSRILSALQGPLRWQFEKLSGRIAVSPAARTTIVDHLGGDAVVVPNGVDVARFAGADPLPGWPGAGGALAFVGRVDESRKGLDVLLSAFTALRQTRPALRLLIAGPGEYGELAPLPDGVTSLGRVDEATKARVHRSADVFVAPNIGGESFGLVLLEAMAAGTPIVASDLDAFRRVLDGGRLGELAAVGDADALAACIGQLLDDPSRRESLAAAASRAVRRYDWSVVAAEVVRVYETAMAAAHGRVIEVEDADLAGAEVHERE